MKKVVIGLSGGVDSAVACLLLKEQGYDVQAIFMQNWDSYINNENYNNQKDKCDNQYEWEDAQAVANKIGVPITKIDFIDEYWNDVFKDFIDGYKNGYTPNPDILCNRYIKFGHLLEYAIKQFNCDYIATGHYAKVIHYSDHSELHRCVDQKKDQTYFLCGLNQAQLKKCMFPLSELTKIEVRKIAELANLPVWNKRDSTGICFIGKRDFKEFLSNYIPNKPGDIVDIANNKIVGKHIGAMYYTIGQNNGLGLGGCKSKYYICKKDIENSVLYVVDEKDKDKFLLSYHCTLKEFNWINQPIDNIPIYVRFRHGQTLIETNVTIEGEKVILDYPSGVLSLAQGQYAVLYQDTSCLGGAIICDVNLNKK